MSSKQTTYKTWPRQMIAATLFLLAGLLVYQSSPWANAPRVVEGRAQATTFSPQQLPRTRRIEDIRVGQRVWADNPDVDTTDETLVDPATWRLIRLRAETVWDDGTIDDINVETLQSPAWIEHFQARVGSSVPIPLDLVEMGLPENLLAKVLAIERCPTIEAGPGRVVLTTVNHLNNNAYEVTVEDAQGRRQTTRPTGFHKFYRPLDGTWDSIQSFQPGEQLRAAAGQPVTVVSVEKLPGTHHVYNLTVEGEHAYHVTKLGLLAHNNGCAAAPRVDLNDLDSLALEYAIHRTSGRPHFWDDMARSLNIDPADLAKLKSKIRGRAREHGLIPEPARTNRHGVADFSGHTAPIVDRATGEALASRRVFIPETVGVPYGRHETIFRQKYLVPDGYVVDHVPKDGWFQLVERAKHALTDHRGHDLWRIQVD